MGKTTIAFSVSPFVGCRIYSQGDPCGKHVQDSTAQGGMLRCLNTERALIQNVWLI